MRSYYDCYKMVGTIMKIILGSIFIIGILLSSVVNKRSTRVNELESKIDKYVYDEGWRQTENGRTLQFAINVKYTKFIFDEKEIFKTVQRKLNYHNRRVEVRKSNRNNGFVVKPRDEIYDLKLRAVLVRNYEFKGVTSDRVFLFSENVNNQFTKKIEAEGTIIPVEGYTDINTINSNEKKMGQQDSPHSKYKMLDDTGADKLLSIGEEVALKDKGEIKYYNYDFSKYERLSYQGINLDDRVTKVLDYRITKYNGGARLKEELSFPEGVFVDGKAIYNIRKGYRIQVGARVGDKYECTIPLKKQKSFKVLLERNQFKAYDNRNWYLLELPRQNKPIKGWVDGKEVNVVRK